MPPIRNTLARFTAGNVRQSPRRVHHPLRMIDASAPAEDAAAALFGDLWIRLFAHFGGLRGDRCVEPLLPWIGVVGRQHTDVTRRFRSRLERRLVFVHRASAPPVLAALRLF